MKKIAFSRSSLLVFGLCGLVLAGGACSSRETKAARHRERAEKYYAAGDFNAAELEFITALRLGNQHDPAIISRLGTLYQNQGKTTKAFAFLSEAKKLVPEDIETRASLAQVYLADHAFSNALTEVMFVLQRQPTHPVALDILADTVVDTNTAAQVQKQLDALRGQAETLAAYHVALGKLAYRKRDWTAATAAYRRALELDPKSVSAHWGLGSVYLSQTNVAQAEKTFAAAEALTPLRSSQRLNYAAYKILSGDVAEGKRLLQAIAAKEPDYLPALVQLATVALSETNHTECTDLVNKILAQDPLQVEALMLGARLKLAQDKADQAIEDLTRLINLYPGVAVAYFHRAAAHLVQHDTTKAIADLQHVVESTPEYADAVFLLADVYLRTARPSDAHAVLTSFLERYPNALRAQFLLAQSAQMLGRLDEAAALCQKLMAPAGQDPRLLVLAGLVARQQGKSAEARGYFENALKVAPGYLPAVQQLAGLDMDAKNWDAAVKRVQEQIAQQPKSAELMWLLASIYESKGDSTQTEAALQKSIALDPEAGGPRQALARFYLKAQQSPKAIALLTDRIATHSDDLDARLLRALAQEQTGQFAEARKDYEHILSVQPNSSAVQNNLAYLLSERFGELDKALELAQAARKLNPGDVALLDTLGWIFVKRGDYASALPLLAESAQKLTREAEVQFHLGTAAYMLGLEKQARTAFEAALQSGKDFPGKSQAQQRLALLRMDARNPQPADQPALEQALKDRADDPVAALRLGAIHEKARAWDEARSVYEKVLAANSKASLIMTRLGWLYAQQFNNPAKAMDLAKAARALAPEDAQVAYLLGRLAFQAQDYVWALNLLEESETRWPSQPDVLYDLAWSYYSVGKLPEAAAKLKLALGAGTLSRAEQARHFQAMLEFSIDPEKAVAAASQIQQALQAQPGDPTVLFPAAYVFQQQNNLEAARQACERVLSRFPLFAPAAKLLARLYLQNPPDYQKAYDLVVKVRDALPNDAEVARTLGIVSYYRKDFPQAISTLKQSAAQRADDAELYYYLGLAHVSVADTNEAKLAFQKALAIAPAGAFADDTRKRLAAMQ